MAPLRRSEQVTIFIQQNETNDLSRIEGLNWQTAEHDLKLYAPLGAQETSARLQQACACEACHLH